MVNAARKGKLANEVRSSLRVKRTTLRVFKDEERLRGNYCVAQVCTVERKSRGRVRVLDPRRRVFSRKRTNYDHVGSNEIFKSGRIKIQRLTRHVGLFLTPWG